MSNSRSFASSPYHVLETGAMLRVVLACGAAGIGVFSRDEHLDAPGVYACITRSVYWGCAKSSVSARARRFTVGGSVPDALLAIVGGTKPFDASDALALERIAFQASQQAGLPLRNRIYPEGAPVGPKRYSELQSAWAQAVASVRDVAPELACAWVGPDYLHADGGLDDEPLPARWRGSLGEARATLRSSGNGYVVEAGSTLRLDPIPSAPGLCQTLRDELAFAGVLVREPRCWRLTRNVYLPTLAACSRLVFTSSSSAYWRVEADNDDVPFEPGFGR